MGSKRIEQSIEDIYEYIEGCKPKGFSGTQVIVVKEEIYDLLDEMKLKIPDEINRCNKLLERRDEIIKEEPKVRKNLSYIPQSSFTYSAPILYASSSATLLA